MRICTIRAAFTSDPVKPGVAEFVSDEDEILYLIEAEGPMIFDGGADEFTPGTAVYIPAGWTCIQQAKKDLKVLVIIAPPRQRTQRAKRPDLILLEPEDAIRRMAHGKMLKNNPARLLGLEPRAPPSALDKRGLVS